MDDRYRAADRIARVLKRWPLSGNDILQYLAVQGLRSIRMAIGLYVFVLVMLLPLWIAFYVTLPHVLGPVTGTMVGIVWAICAGTVVVPAALIVAHHYVSRIRDCATTSGPQPWLRNLSVCRWVLIALAVVCAGMGIWFYEQQYAGGALAGVSNLYLVYWEAAVAALIGASGCQSVLIWLKLTPPSLPVQPTAAQQLWERSSAVIPDKLVVIRTGQRVAIVLITVVATFVVGGGLVWWLVIKPPTGKGWSPMATGLLYPSVYDFGTPNVAVLSSQGSSPDSTVEGIDLATGKVLWSRSGYASFAGDATDMVVLLGAQMDVIDAVTGATKASTNFTNDGTFLLWVGDGRVLYSLYSDSASQLCAASLDDPGNCIWTAPDSPVYLLSVLPAGGSQYVFAGGEYVNTGDGVLQMATGQPASFGADAGQKNSNSYGVYYTGPSPDRVFRVVPPSDSSGYATTSSFQPWDTADDTAISPAINTGLVFADPSISNYLSAAYRDGITTTPATAYDWQSGQQQWQDVIDERDWYDAAQFANGNWLVSVHRTRTVKVLVALDPATGHEVWHGPSNSTLVGVVGNLVYATDGWQKLWSYDMAGNFRRTKSASLPVSSCNASVAGGRVVCFDISTTSTLWVMDD